MEISSKLQVSPFIVAFYSTNNKISVRNFLTDKLHILEKNYITILKELRFPTDTKQLIFNYGLELIIDMIEKDLLIDPDTIWQKTNIKYLEIETTTTCNWRCEYCPVSINPKEKKIMSMDLFNLIINKAGRYPSIKFVTIHSYNEPTLDIYFEERIKKIANANLKLMLFTNGSMLDIEKIRLLKELNVIEYIQFNLPSIDEDKFKHITGYPFYKQTIWNIEQTISNGLNVQFAIKGTKKEQLINLEAIKSKFGPLVQKDITVWQTTDRAGILKDKYAKNINISESLFGCKRVINWIYIGVNGDCFICCEDYYQKEIYGNIVGGEIDEILNSPKAQFLRKQIFGAEIAPKDFLCRKCCRMYESKINTRLIRKISY